MMFVYEKKWPYGKSFYEALWVDNLYFPMHFHNNFEFNYVSDGELDVMLDDKTFKLKAGGGLFIFPKQLHSYIHTQPSRTCVIEFSADMIGNFARKYEGMIPENSIVHGTSIFENNFVTKNYFTQKSVLYGICGILSENTSFKNHTYSKDLQFLHKILTFIDENYMHDCSLQAIAQAMQYSYSYVSKKFTQYMNMSYTEYLNRYRIDRALTLLRSDHTLTISSVCTECGFDSLCSFNRNFKKYTGTTPSDIIKKTS